MSEEDKKNSPVIRISITSVVGEGKQQMTMETYADAASTAEFLNAITDKLFYVANRQAKLGEIEGMKKLLETEVNQLAALEADLVRQDQHHEKLKSENNTRTPFKLPPNEKAARENIKTNILVRRERIERLKADINTREVEWGVKK